MEKYDVIVVGGGPGGLAAACAARKAGAQKVLVLERDSRAGGILNQCIHDGFGLIRYKQTLAGPEYANRAIREALDCGVEIKCGAMVIEMTDKRIVTAVGHHGIHIYEAGAVVLATGCRERTRGAVMIPGTRPAGIFSAGTAQKLVNCMGYQVGKRVVILGSGDIGLIMARRMSYEGAKVEAVCEVMPYSGGLTRNIVQCLEDFNIPLYLSTTVVQIHGRERLEGVTIAQVDEKRQPIEETKRYIPCDTLLLSVGLIPENELTRGAGIPIDPVTNGAIVDENCQTGVPGIFACGNVLQVHDLVDYVSEEAERAGLGAVKYIREELDTKRAVQTKPGFGVRYVLPQTVHPGNGDVSLFLRVTQPFGKVKFTVADGDRVLAVAKKLKAAPGEMEKITIKADALNDVTGPITVSLEVL